MVAATCPAASHHASSEEPRRQVEKGIERQPGQRHEIPVDAVVLDIHEMFSFDWTEPQQRHEYPGLDRLEEEKRRMERHNEPCRRCVGGGIPVNVELAEIEDPEREADCGECTHEHDAASNGGDVH